MFSWKIHLVIQRPIRPTLQDADNAHYVTSQAHAAAQSQNTVTSKSQPARKPRKNAVSCLIRFGLVLLRGKPCNAIVDTAFWRCKFIFLNSNDTKPKHSEQHY